MLKCVLCMKEQRFILDRSNRSPETMINSTTEIYGACRHNPDFHRYCVPATASTDDRLISERIQDDTGSPVSTNNSPNSIDDVCTGLQTLNLFQTVEV